MFEISPGDDGRYCFSGKLDASHAEKTRKFFDSIQESCVLDFENLVYISSVGLGLLVSTKRRLQESGHTLRLVNLNTRISDLFRVTLFDQIFDIE